MMHFSVLILCHTIQMGNIPETTHKNTPGLAKIQCESPWESSHLQSLFWEKKKNS